LILGIVRSNIEAVLRQRRRENEDAEERNDFWKSHHKIDSENNDRSARPKALNLHQAPDTASIRERSHRAVIRVYDDAGNVIETHQHAGEFKEW
jgi:hypothetical protein